MTANAQVTERATRAGAPSIDVGATDSAPRARAFIYWTATVFVAGNALIAGVMNILRISPFPTILMHLGYPAYFGTMLGTWKVVGALALVIPKYPRVKEWAYAGSFIDYTAAIVSYIAVGAGCVTNLAGPLVTIILLGVSWALRPASRRLRDR